MFNEKVLQQSQEVSYIAALDLQKDAFSPDPDSLFYYPFESFEQRLSVLNGLVHGTDLFVLVIGEPGSGKTTLLNRFLNSIDTQWVSARIITDPETAAAQSTKLQEHRGYPAYVLQDSSDPIVIVDDAHQLPSADLEFLIHEALVPGSTDKIKRLVLFGESRLYTAVTKLAASLSAQPAVNKIYLPGLTEEETAGYLRHRLAIAGFSGEMPMNSSEVREIHRNSGGYPGPINAIAHQWLNEKYSSKKEGPKMLQKLSATPQRRVAWIGVGVIVIALAAVWLFIGRKTPTQKTPDQKLTKTVVRQKVPPYPKRVKKAEVPKVAAVKTNGNPAATNESQQRPAAAPQAEPQARIETDQTQKKETEAAEKVSTASLGKQNPAAPEPAATTQLKKDKTAPPEAATATPLKKDKTAPPKRDAAASLKKESEPKIVRQQEIKPAKSKPVPTGVESAAKKVRREKWLLSQDGTTYTVQIIGVSNEASLMDFIKKNQLLKQNEIAYHESTFRGKPWFQLLYGIYPDKQAARLAAKKLPENIRQAGPWIRNIAAVQRAIKN